MMLLPGCVAGMEISPIPQRGPLASQRMSLAIFVRLIAIVFSSPLASTIAVLGRLRFEMICRFDKFDAGFLRDHADRLRRKIRMRIDSRADRRPAQRQARAARESPCDTRIVRKLGLMRIPAKFLPQPDRRRILQMRPADLHDSNQTVSAFCLSVSARCSSAGISDSLIAIAALMCIAVGITSLELCSMLT